MIRLVGLAWVLLLSCVPGMVRGDGTDVLDKPPAGFFTKLVLAHGYKEIKDAYQTDRYRPENPSSTFRADVPAIYMVFDLLPRESPANIIGQLFLVKDEGKSEQMLYQEGVYLTTSQDSGFIEFFQPSAGWVPGEYKIKIHIGEKVTGASQLGTLRFTIVPAS